MWHTIKQLGPVTWAAAAVDAGPYRITVGRVPVARFGFDRDGEPDERAGVPMADHQQAAFEQAAAVWEALDLYVDADTEPAAARRVVWAAARTARRVWWIFNVAVLGGDRDSYRVQVVNAAAKAFEGLPLPPKGEAYGQGCCHRVEGGGAPHQNWNRLRIELALVEPTPRCRLLPPNDWPKTSVGTYEMVRRWLGSGGSPFVLGECRRGTCPLAK